MPEERNEELSLREALTNAFTAEPEEGGAVVEEGAAEMTDPAVPAEETAVQDGAVGDVPAAESVPSAAETAQAAPPAQNTGMPSVAELWQAMQQQNAAMQRLMQENQRLSDVVNQQNGAMQQQSEAAEGAIMRQFTPAAAAPKQEASPMAPPVLNMTEFGYLSPEDQNARLMQWQTETMNYAARMAAAQAKEELVREMAPVREDYESKRRIAENEAAKATLFAMPQFADMKGKDEDIERVIAGTKALEGASPDERYMLAALISRGIHAGKQPTAEELIKMASSNPDVMKALEARRVAEIQQNNASLPKVVPSSGMSNANAVPENRPKTTDDIREKLYKMIGVRR